MGQEAGLPGGVSGTVPRGAVATVFRPAIGLWTLGELHWPVLAVVLRGGRAGGGGSESVEHREGEISGLRNGGIGARIEEPTRSFGMTYLEIDAARVAKDHTGRLREKRQGTNFKKQATFGARAGCSCGIGHAAGGDGGEGRVVPIGSSIDREIGRSDAENSPCPCATVGCCLLHSSRTPSPPRGVRWACRGCPMPL